MKLIPAIMLFFTVTALIVCGPESLSCGSCVDLWLIAAVTNWWQSFLLHLPIGVPEVHITIMQGA